MQPCFLGLIRVLPDYLSYSENIMEITPRRGCSLIIVFLRSRLTKLCGSLGLAVWRMDSFPGLFHPATRFLRARVLSTRSSKFLDLTSQLSRLDGGFPVQGGQHIRLSPSDATSRPRISRSFFGRLRDLHGRHHHRPARRRERDPRVQRSVVGWYG